MRHVALLGAGCLLIVGSAASAEEDGLHPDTLFIRTRIQEHLRGHEAVPAWEVDTHVVRETARLSGLMRREFRGMQRLHVLPEEDFADLQRGQPSTGFIPLNQMGADQTYKGQEGGLYGGGSNEPPAAHRAAAQRALAAIQPRDREGNVSATGKIVLLGLGMSNTRRVLVPFKEAADDDPEKAAHVVVVNGAAGGQDARVWADPYGGFGRAVPIPSTDRRGTSWEYADACLAQEGVTPQQVQAVWIKQALMGPAQYGAFPGHAELLKECMGVMVREAKRRYPNLQVAYLSSRTYAGYAVRELNPEPFAYESAFAVRGLIREQIDGNNRYNHDPSRGEVVAPVLLWGPYLWADGQTPRASDGLVWTREDFTPVPDGTHPSERGSKKAGRLLLTFFKTSPLAKSWFLANGM